MARLQTDILVVGAGIAGLCAAIAARETGAEVLLTCLDQPGKANATAVSGTLFNAALGFADQRDTKAAHFTDTINAGAGLNNEDLVSKVVEEIPLALNRLVSYGVRFREQNGAWVQFRSPGHTYPRTIYCDACSGSSLTGPLVEHAKEIGVRFLPQMLVTRIITSNGEAVGALGISAQSLEKTILECKTIILATGGSGMLYRRNAIPAVMPGNGYALALEAGCKLIDMEFIQYYPTFLAEPDWPHLLIAYDTVMMHGASFRNSDDVSISEKYGFVDPQMITRDQFTRAIGLEIAAGKGVNGTVLLEGLDRIDISDPLIMDLAIGKLITKIRQDHLPRNSVKVAPSVHYFMGGVQIDPNGETGVPGLMACGEATGGIHGANRLQGNALSAAAVFGLAVGERAGVQVQGKQQIQLDTSSLSLKNNSSPNFSEKGRPIREAVEQLQLIMEKHVGIIRCAEGLNQARQEIRDLIGNSAEFNALTNSERLKALAFPMVLQTALCIIEGALARKESRGAHFRSDYPSLEQKFTKHIIIKADVNDLLPIVVN